MLDWVPWGWLRAEVQAEQDLIFSTYGFVDNPTFAEHLDGGGRIAWLGPPVCGLVPGPRPDMTVIDFSRPDAIYRLADARWRWERTENLQAALRLDRLNLRLGTPDTHLIIGRQAVDLGSGWLWNPLDVFEAFDPRVIDRDHRYGVDAARLRVALGSRMHAELIGAAGRGQAQNSEPPPPGLSWYGSALLARFAGRFDAWTLAVQAGKVYAGYQAGFEVGARLGIWRLKGQGAYYLPDFPPRPRSPRRRDRFDARRR